MKKVVLFAFNAEFMCFVHVLLNALDMDSRGFDVKIVIEGGATALIPELTREGSPLVPCTVRSRSENSFTRCAGHAPPK